MVVRKLRVNLGAELLFLCFMVKTGLWGQIFRPRVSRAKRIRGFRGRWNVACLAISTLASGIFVLALQAYAVLCPHLCLQPYSFPYVRVSACADNTTKSVLSPRIMFSTAHRASPRAWLPNKKDFMVSCASASRKREVHDWQQEKGWASSSKPLFLR